MARTRDVLLGLLCLGFLLTVGASQFGRLANNQSPGEYVVPETDPVETVEVETIISEDKREERVAMWRERLRDFVITAPVVEETPLADEQPVEDSGVNAVTLCADYRVYAPAVPRLYNYEAEGVRVFSSVAELELVDGTNTFLVLPVRFTQSNAGRNCLATDVIGIAENGSLLRNNQHNTYSIFEAQTLVGYALDGFPIYGRIDGSALDACGGRVTPEGYQYHIAPERDSIVQCFSAPPVELP